MKGISLRTPEDIRKELSEEWNDDVQAMAYNYNRTKEEILSLINGTKNK